jgi:hypothetical protein
LEVYHFVQNQRRPTVERDNTGGREERPEGRKRDFSEEREDGRPRKKRRRNGFFFAFDVSSFTTLIS